MLMSCIFLLLLLLINAVLTDLPPYADRSTPIPRPPELLGPYQTSPPPDSLPKPCADENCRPPANLVGPIVGTTAGVLASVLISLVLVWFYFKRRNRKNEEISKTPEVEVVEYPSLYTGAISTTDSTSKLYGMSPTRNNSIDSHYYEKIHYNE